MYTGTLIDELMATVERAEQGTREREAVTEEVERFIEGDDFTLADIALGAYARRWFGVEGISKPQLAHLERWFAQSEFARLEQTYQGVA